jgi:hypothetical protein
MTAALTCGIMPIRNGSDGVIGRSPRFASFSITDHRRKATMSNEHTCQDENATVVNGRWLCNCPGKRYVAVDEQIQHDHGDDIDDGLTDDER